MPTSPTPRAALYARVSTHHGQDVGLQLDALREVAAARGWVVVEEFVDEGVSGSKQRRPALDALMASARAGEIGELADGIAARIYLPELSRFVSADTITPDMVWEANAFTYVRNNPLKYVDPDGHSVWIKAGKILWKLAKGGGKGLDLALTFKGIIDDWSTLTNPSLPFSDHLIAGLSLSSEILPLSVDDLRWLDEIADAGQLKKVFGGGDAMAKQSLKKSASAAEGTGSRRSSRGMRLRMRGRWGRSKRAGECSGRTIGSPRTQPMTQFGSRTTSGRSPRIRGFGSPESPESRTTSSSRTTNWMLE